MFSNPRAIWEKKLITSEVTPQNITIAQWKLQQTRTWSARRMISLTPFQSQARVLSLVRRTMDTLTQGTGDGFHKRRPQDEPQSSKSLQNWKRLHLRSRLLILIETFMSFSFCYQNEVRWWIMNSFFWRKHLNTLKRTPQGWKCRSCSLGEAFPTWRHKNKFILAGSLCWVFSPHFGSTPASLVLRLFHSQILFHCSPFERPQITNTLWSLAFQ